MPREPAYAAERRQDAEAKAACERAKDRMSAASVRRRGVGSPEQRAHRLCLTYASQAASVTSPAASRSAISIPVRFATPIRKF